MLESKHLILVGGGHAHAQVIPAFAARRDLRVTLIDPQAAATYSGMVPGCIGGHYSAAETQIDLKALSQWAGIEFVQDRVVDIDFERQCVYLEQHSPLIYDAVSLDVGSTTRGWRSTAGAKEYTIPTRPIHALVQRLEETRRPTTTPIQLVVVGGGAAGIELSMAVTTRWTQHVECTLLDAGSQLMASENENSRRMLQQVLTDRNITVRHKAHVAQVTAQHVILQEGSRIEYTHCIWAAGAEAHDDLSKRLQQRGLACTEHGWIAVHPTLQSTSHPAVFAAGDCASIQGLTRGRPPPPKAGVYAVRAGPVLVQNLLNYLLEKSPEWAVYEPQDDFLKLLVCGNGKALGFRFGLSFYGKWVFDMKDRIDRNFMELFDPSKLPDKSLLERGDYRVQQYDAGLDDAVVLEPREAAVLLQRSDDGVDYQVAWSVLRAMARDSKYREQVLECVKSLPMKS